ncbi:MAG: hypothetical protein ABF289_06745 [Clostridiales bacterium]
MELLKSLFSERNEKLKNNLLNISQNSYDLYLEDLAKQIYSEIDVLLGEEGLFRKKLTNQEEAILIRVLNLIKNQSDFYHVSFDKTNFITSGKKVNKRNHEVPVGIGFITSITTSLLNINPILKICIPIVAFVGSEVVSNQVMNNESNNIEEKAYKLSEGGCEKVIAAIEKLCKDIDDLIDCFKSQEENVKIKYESQNKPFKVKYRILLEKIANLIGTINNSPSILNDDLKMETKILENELISMGFKLINYPNLFEKLKESELYDIIIKDDISTRAPVYPAVLMDNKVVIKGRVDVPDK